MTPLDVWASGAAFLGGAAVAIRARMLRPHQKAWTHAPAPVWVSLHVLALTLTMAGVSISFGAHATAREAAIYTILAATGVIMLWNLDRNGRLEQVRRQAFAAEAKLALEVSGPPQRYRGERTG